MAEHYRFFNSTEGDIREYLARDFAEYFSCFLSDGLYTEKGRAGLKVTPGMGLTVNIDTGYAFVRGYMYKNDAIINKTLEPADTMLDRIDRIVLRLDEVERRIHVTVKKGAFSSTPQPPALEITNTIKELSLAQVRIRSKATSINTYDITDERLSDYCGLVSSIIEIPAQEMWDVWNQKLNEIEAAWQTKKGNIQSEWEGIKVEWTAWFESVKNTLGIRFMAGTTEPADIQAGDIWLREL